MAAACKALPRCTRAYSAVIDRQATLSYECVDSTKPGGSICMHTSHALVKLFIGRQCHLITIGAQNSWYAIPSRTPGRDIGPLLHTLNYGLAAVLPQKHARRRCPLNRKG